MIVKISFRDFGVTSEEEGEMNLSGFGRGFPGLIVDLQGRRNFGDGLYGSSWVPLQICKLVLAALVMGFVGSGSALEVRWGKKASGSHALVSAWTLGNGVLVAGPMCNAEKCFGGFS
ncbi:hypothetical protein U1Q18_036383 [Sarracenia purpurea var. burkii]